jgi:anti-sigma B factor antagonist
VVLNKVSQDNRVLILSAQEARLDAAVAPQFREEFIEFSQDSPGTIILDLSAVTFLDSSGLGALVGALKRTGPRGDLLLTGLTPAANRAVKLTRMDRVFTIYPDTATALQHVEG